MIVTEVPNTWDARVRMFSAGSEIVGSAIGSEVDCFVVLTDRFAVVIDTFSTPEDATQMMELVRPALAGRPSLVVNTHQHYDHVWGNSLFAPGNEFAAPILASGLSREPARKQPVRLLEKQAEEPRFAGHRVAPPP